MVGAEQAPKDTDGCLKKIYIYILVEGEFFLYPIPCFGKLYKDWGKVHDRGSRG